MADFAKSSDEFNEYFRSIIAERRGMEGDDLVSKVVNTEIDGDSLSEAEMLTMLRQLLAAGNDTTTNLIGSCLLLLAQDPDMYHRIRSEEGFIKSFIEEVLRLESPIQGLHRTAMADTAICGVPIPEGSQVLLMYGGANRDPHEFNDPGDCRPDRQSTHGHLAFGHGVHHCIGAPLARAEARIALECFARRVETLALAPDADVVYEPSFLLRGLERLHLTFAPAA
jgi:cytochrome P450